MATVPLNNPPWTVDKWGVPQPNLFWVVVGPDAPTGCTIKPMGSPPRPGDRINVDGNVCVVDRVGPPPPGSHVVTGIVYATRA